MPVSLLRSLSVRVVSVLDLSDLIGLIGFVSLLYGLAQWSQPAAYVTAGVLLMGLAVAPYLRKARK
jgi:hypothetical protein